MKAIILALLLVATFSALSEVANKPIPPAVKGTSSKFYLDGQANPDCLFKTVNVPEFVQVSTDGLLSYDVKNVGSWPIELKVYDKKSGESQNRQYILRVVDKPT